eukprot:SAG11_NODE_553_length_8575_cov_18.074328_1_plen_50_part_10
MADLVPPRTHTPSLHPGLFPHAHIYLLFVPPIYTMAYLYIRIHLYVLIQL